MADRYLNFTGTAPGRFLTRRLGLPQPAQLHRWTPERPVLDGPLLHLTAGESVHTAELAGLLARTGPDVRAAAERPAAIVLDATAVTDIPTLAEVHAALHPVARAVASSGRIVVLGAPLVPRRPPPGRRPAGARRVRALPRQGDRPRPHRHPRTCRRARGSRRVDTAIPPLAQVRVRQRPGDRGRGRRHHRARRLGAPPGRPHGPGHRAPPAASARRWRRSSRGTGPV